MKRLLWLIFAGLAVAAAVLLMRGGEDQGSVASAAPAPEPEPQVRVVHELVTVDPPPIATLREEPSHAPMSQPSRRPADGPRLRRAMRDPGLLERAGRAIVGDGTHRPEPFPRIRQF